MRFVIPQNLDIEDTLFLSLTFKQTLYLLGSGGVIFISFSLLPTILAFIVAIPIATLGISLAYIKINNQTFAEILKSFILYTIAPKLYRWKRVDSLKKRTVTQQIDQSSDSLSKQKRNKNLKKIKDIAYSLEVER